MGSISLSNIQGDILLDGLPKRNESFFLFTIADDQVQAFCQSLPKVAEHIVDCEHTKAIRARIAQDKANNKDGDLISTVGACIAFSRRGLDKMDTFLKTLKVDSMGDIPFKSGMKAVAKDILQDPVANGQPKYEPTFMSPDKLHGVILVASNTRQGVDNKLAAIKKVLGSTVKEVDTIKGKVRPKPNKGHEHFGYEDGISQPRVKGVAEERSPGGGEIRPGIALCGRDGDGVQNRPKWMKDGSFMCFRKLKQNVQEWDKMTKDVADAVGSNSEKVGARLIGRWKSGCPVALSVTKDDPKFAKDTPKVNDFTYNRGDHVASPPGAHIRKTFPRGELPASSLEEARILRRGIPYGEELPDPGERGLLFVCYQSNIEKGYQFIQASWANSETFLDPGAGRDITMGQENNDRDKTHTMLALNASDLKKPATFAAINKFVVPKGGEYFFMPSMSALKNELAGKGPKSEL